MDIEAIMRVVHVFAVTAMVGATIVNGLLHARARSSSPERAAPVVSAIMLVNRAVMAPSLLLLPLSGLLLAWRTGYDLRVLWLALSIGLTLLLIGAFLIGLRYERRLERIAESAARSGAGALPDAYRRAFASAAPIGSGALLLSLAVIVLMVVKPV